MSRSGGLLPIGDVAPSCRSSPTSSSYDYNESFDDDDDDDDIMALLESTAPKKEKTKTDSGAPPKKGAENKQNPNQKDQTADLKQKKVSFADGNEIVASERTFNVSHRDDSSADRPSNADDGGKRNTNRHGPSMQTPNKLKSPSFNLDELLKITNGEGPSDTVNGASSSLRGRTPKASFSDEIASARRSDARTEGQLVETSTLVETPLQAVVPSNTGPGVTIRSKPIASISVLSAPGKAPGETRQSR